MPTKFTDEFIAAELEKAERATVRPWEVWKSTYGFGVISIYDEKTERPALDICGTWDSPYVDEPEAMLNGEANSAFIISAANNYPDALNEILRLREALESVEHEARCGGDMTDHITKIANDALKGA